MLINQMWENHNENSIVYRYHDESVTYKELSSKVNKIRDYFNSIGITKGENVGLYCKNCPEFVFVYFAIVSLGAVVVPINRTLTANEVGYIASDAKMKHIVTMQKLDLDDNLRQLTISDIIDEINTNIFDEIPNNHEANEDDVAVIIYTSGTTGYPKGAMLTHKNLVSNTIGIVKALDINASDNILCVLPMFHSFAWTTTVLSALYTGGTTVIMENFHPKEALKLIQNENMTIICGVPTMYTYYLSLGTKEIFKTVKVFVSGGASLPVEVTVNFKSKFDCSIVEGYGLSEASPVVAVNPMDNVRVGSIGLPILDVEVRIVDTESKIMAEYEVGELIVNGPNVMKGYYNMAEETEKTIVSGWLHTGDLGYKDSDGYIYIVDRLKDIIIVGGMNVYPREVEELIYRFEGVVEVAVIGIPDETRGEVVAAFVVTQGNDLFDTKQLKKFLRENLANFKLPKEIVIMDSLPKNATGKIMKKVLKSEYCDLKM